MNLDLGEIKPDLLETKTDLQGNRYFYFPLAPKVTSLFHKEPQTSRAILTPMGKELLKEVGHQQVFHKIADDSVVKDPKPLGKGAEADVRRVYDADNYLKAFFSRKSVKVVEKRFKTEHLQPALGWEVLELFDHVRPVVEANSFRLVPTFGATNRSIYLAYIEGPTFKKFISSLGKGKYELWSSMDESTRQLHYSLVEAVNRYLESKGFRRYTKGNQLMENDPDKFYSVNEALKVNALVDVCPTPFANRYRNWIVPEESANKFKESAKIDLPTAIKELKKNLVLVDPVAVYRL